MCFQFGGLFVPLFSALFRALYYRMCVCVSVRERGAHVPIGISVFCDLIAIDKSPTV